MIVIKGNQFVYFDVDDSLVMWQWPNEGTNDFITLRPWNDDEVKKLAINTEMVKQLIQHSIRNQTVVVWSAGGWKWAETVVKALGIEKYVTVVIEKPTWVFDDLPPNKFMPKSRWVGNKNWLNRGDDGI
jgi:hypothetical protein